MHNNLYLYGGKMLTVHHIKPFCSSFRAICIPYLFPRCLFVLGLEAVKGPIFWTKKFKGWALILYNFKLKILRASLDCEEATRAMVHYHLYIFFEIKGKSTAASYKKKKHCT